MNKPIKYSKKKIESIAELMQGVPIKEDAEQYSGFQVVEQLKNEIIQMRARGYSLEDISDFMKGHGLSIATPTLKNYLAQVSRKSKKKAGSTAKKRVAGIQKNTSENSGKHPKITNAKPVPATDDDTRQYRFETSDMFSIRSDRNNNDL